MLQVKWGGGVRDLLFPPNQYLYPVNSAEVTTQGAAESLFKPCKVAANFLSLNGAVYQKRLKNTDLDNVVSN